MLKGKIEIHNRVSIDSSHKEGKTHARSKYLYSGCCICRQKNKYWSKNWHTIIHQNGIMSPLYVTEREYLDSAISPEGHFLYGRKICIKQSFPSAINAFPLCIDTKDKEEIIRFVKAIHPVFGAVK